MIILIRHPTIHQARLGRLLAHSHVKEPGDLVPEASQDIDAAPAATATAARAPVPGGGRSAVASSPATSRNPGAQLSLFETAGGWRYSLWATNRPDTASSWLGQNAYID
jgi:hypothetical protein